MALRISGSSPLLLLLPVSIDTSMEVLSMVRFTAYLELISLQYGLFFK